MAYHAFHFHTMIENRIKNSLDSGYTFSYARMIDKHGYKVFVYESGDSEDYEELTREWPVKYIELSSLKTVPIICDRIKAMVNVLKAIKFRKNMQGKLPL